MTSTITDILLRLYSRRVPLEEIPVLLGSGVYAFYVRQGAQFGALPAIHDGPIYIGVTESSLAARNHFSHKQSGFSTLRRSLGAILKSELNLTAMPRAPGPSKTNTRSFRFEVNDETRLSKWMSEYLLCSQIEWAGDLRAIERQLVAEAKPSLNLMLWPNPWRREIRRLRDICRNEAAQSAEPGERP